MLRSHCEAPETTIPATPKQFAAAWLTSWAKKLVEMPTVPKRFSIRIMRIPPLQNGCRGRGAPRRRISNLFYYYKEKSLPLQ